MWLPDFATLFIAVCTFCALTTLVLLLSLRRRPLTCGILLLAFAPISLILVMLTQDLISYRNLAVEQRIASVFVAQDGEKSFNLRLDIEGNSMPYIFPLRGEEWRLEGRVLRWEPALAKLGLNNLVRLERLSGRYQLPEHEVSSQRTVHPLPSGEWLDSWPLLSDYAFIWRWVEVDYGSGVYAPLEDGAVFGVYLGRSGMFIRPENPIAINALRAWST